jgi:DMSO reductase anchor subunit
VANIATSWLSREIAVLVVFIAAAAALVVGESRGFGAAFRSALAFLAAGSGGALVFSMSRIYRLPTVPDWDSASTPAAFISSASVLGSALASIVVRTWNPALETNLPRATLYVLAAAFAVALLFAPRFGLLARRRPSPAFRPDPKAPAVFAVRMMLFALAIFFWAVSMIKPEAAGVTRWASMAFLFESEVFGRMLFYTIPADL